MKTKREKRNISLEMCKKKEYYDVIVGLGAWTKIAPHLERDEDLDRIIQRLVEFDKEGQALVQEAQKQRSDTLAHMNDYKRELAASYFERAESRVEIFRAQANADRDEQLLTVRKRFDAQSAKLREIYQQKGGQWVQQIVDRCVGR